MTSDTNQAYHAEVRLKRFVIVATGLEEAEDWGLELKELGELIKF